MRNFFLNILITLISLSFLSFANSEEIKTKESEINLFTGVFDFSDQNQKGNIFGFQHQNDELFRNSFLGKLSPITGGWLTDNNSVYLYTGAQAEYWISYNNTKFCPRILQCRRCKRFRFTFGI